MILALFLALGISFSFIGVIGILRFPDVYTRLHASTKCTTFGSIFTSMAVFFFGFKHVALGSEEYLILSIHSLVALGLLLITNPTGAHAISRAAHINETKALLYVDKLKEK